MIRRGSERQSPIGLQDRDGIIGEVIDLLLVCLLKGGRVTPTVVVESEEIATGVVAAAVQVVSGFNAVFICTWSIWLWCK